MYHRKLEWSNWKINPISLHNFKSFETPSGCSERSYVFKCHIYIQSNLRLQACLHHRNLVRKCTLHSCPKIYYLLRLLNIQFIYVKKRNIGYWTWYQNDKFRLTQEKLVGLMNINYASIFHPLRTPRWLGSPGAGWTASSFTRFRGSGCRLTAEEGCSRASVSPPSG